ncbi:hypothetical protein AB0K18_42685 [Nonomuraea sp. NPDC049421]|uniref:hypothetical protein n=1 Tax=Nonomuraea sp. NPDC049421 TaxID=3155275 RepID=UPI003423D84D
MMNPAKRAHGSRIVGVLEQAWSAIQKHHPDVPAVVAITGTGHVGGFTMGSFDFKKWKPAGDVPAASEVFIAGEVIGVGGRLVMETLLHEAAHGLAGVRGIKDTSSKNRYHNLKFARLAEELGLKRPASKDLEIGWSECTITDATAEKYRDVIDAIDAERLPYRDSPYVAYLRSSQQLDQEIAELDKKLGDLLDGALGEAVPELPPVTVPQMPALPTGRDGVRVSVACSCTPPRRMQGSPASIERGPIICGECREEFVIAEPTRRRPKGPRVR